MVRLLPLAISPDAETFEHVGNGVAVGGFFVRVGVHEGTGVRVGVRVSVGMGVLVGTGVRLGVGVSVGMGAQARPRRQPPEPDGVPPTPSAF
jgi:carbonic anhydrase/acetyltransferase-like protein (isoleucine patch superfamily)